MVKGDKINITNTQIHDRSLPGLGTDTSIISGGVKLILLAKNLVLLPDSKHAYKLY